MAEWRQVGEHLHAVARSSAWWIGDWVHYGQQAFPQFYRGAIEESGLDYQTLRNYAWVASRFPPDRRRPSLSLQHHAEVAALTPADQEDLLDEASQGSWSRNAMRREARRRRTRCPEAIDPPERVAVAVCPHRLRVWTLAAEFDGRDLESWVEAALDSAARSCLGCDHDG